MSATALPLLREAAEQQLQLLSAAAGLPPANQRRLQQVFSLLSGDALDRPAEPHYPGLSHINASGLPLQWSVAAGEPLPSVRFLTECGPVGAPGPERLANSFARLQQAARLIGAENAALQAEQLTRQHLLPNAWPAHWRSALWSAAGAVGNHIALKIYCNLTAGDPASRWRRAGQLLATLGRTTALESLCHCSRLASRDSWPAGIAIALSPFGIGGVKIYFRSGAVETTSWLSRWYLACGYPHAEEHARLLLEIFAPPSRTPAPPGAIVVSLEFPPGDRPPALKTELELNRPSPTEQTTAARVRHLLHRMAIPAGPYEDALAALAPPGHQPTIHRLIGLRTDPSGTRRANIYLEPPPPALPTARPRLSPRAANTNLPEVSRAGLAWLAARRQHAGGWSGFALPVGTADHWVTAYVAFHTGLGCEHLASLRGPRGAWGYNAATPEDADSTALAALALARAGHPVDVRRFLASCWRDDGGVATYPHGTPPGGAWCESTVDVTPVVAEYLSPPDPARTLDWLLGRQRPDGLWNGYWWVSPLYPAWWVARVFGRQLPPAPRQRLIDGISRWSPTGAFELALLVLTRRELGLPFAQQRDALARLQKPDGSWEPGAWLRLPRPNCREPWTNLASGPCYLDHDGVFTTATALGSLTEQASRPTGLDPCLFTYPRSR